jgi:C1A family cysteine protease
MKRGLPCIIFVLILLSLILLSPHAAALANPAAVYCTESGYEYEIKGDTEGDQYGNCVMPDKTKCKDWDFFEGKCGKKFAKQIDISEKLKATELGASQPSKGKKSFALSAPQKISSEYNYSDYGDGWDWRNPPAGTKWEGKDWMTAVKNQGVCGSCWAQAALGTVEAKYNIYNNDSEIDLDLAEQELISCCSNCGNCSGGWTKEALDYVLDNGVIDESCFSYNSSCTEGEEICDSCDDRCADNQSRNYKIIDWILIADDLNSTKQALIDNGPLSVVINVTSVSPFEVGDCTQLNQGNHAVVLTGYNNSTSKWIIKNSWGSGWNGNGYAEINYSALCTQTAYSDAKLAVNITETKPSVTLVSPPDRFISSLASVTFNCSAQDIDGINGLKNMTLWGNFTGSWLANETKNLTGTDNSTTFNLDLPVGTYVWNCLAYDQRALGDWADNLTLTIPPINVELSTPADLLNSSETNQTFNCSANSTAELVNLSIYVWNSTTEFYTNTINVTGTSNSSEWQVNLTENERYNWNCFAYDNSTSAWTNNRTLTIDAIDPSVNLDISDSSIDEGDDVSLNCTASDAYGVKNITISYSGTTIKTCSSSPCVYDYTPSWTGTKTITCTVYDYASNSDTDSGTLAVEEDDGGDGGNGGSGGDDEEQSQTYDISDDLEEDNEKTQKLAQGDSVKFKINRSSHSLKVSRVYSDKAKLEISSDPFYVTIALNETKQVDVDNNSLDDLAITLLDIVGDNVKLKLELIEEKTPEENASNTDTENLTINDTALSNVSLTNDTNLTQIQSTQKKMNIGWIWGIAIVVLAIIVTSLVYIKRKFMFIKFGGKHIIKRRE